MNKIKSVKFDAIKILLTLQPQQRMTTANVIATETPKELKRFVPVNRKSKDIMTKIDYAGIMESWKPVTNILDRIKRNDPKNIIRVKITPDMALDLLTLNDMTHQRDIDQRRIKEYSKAMKDKRWMEGNGDTIAISTEIKLLNGQHRLWSIWISKQTIEYLIVTGIEPKAFAYMDGGKNRTGKDVAATRGYKSISTPLSYAIKSIILFEKRGIVKGAVNSFDVPNSEINDWMEEEARMAWMVKAYEKIKITWMESNKNFFTAPQWLFVYYVLKSLPMRQKSALEFLDQFADGTNLSRTSPIKVARTYFENDMDQFIRYKKKKSVDRNILAIKVKVLFAAWDLWLAKTHVQKIEIDLKTPIIKKPNWQVNN